MRKLFCLFLTLMITCAVTVSCSPKNSGTDAKQNPVPDNPKNTQSDEKKADSTTAVPKTDEKKPEFKITEGDTFAYIDSKGMLMFKNINDGLEQAVINREGVLAYDFNLKNNLLAFIASTDKDSPGGKAYIYNMNTKSVQELDSGDGARRVTWSSSSKYLTVDHGTSASGFTRVYDIVNKKWLDMPSEQKTGIMCSDYEWSPGADILALVVQEPVSKPTPIEEGDSRSIAVLYPGRNGGYRVIAKGTESFGYFITKWADANNIYAVKQFYEDIDKNEYYKININDGTMTKAAKEAAVSAGGEASLPDDVNNSIYSVSPNGKLVLYSMYDAGFNGWKVMLWDIDKKTAKEICKGSFPQWVLVK